MQDYLGKEVKVRSNLEKKFVEILNNLEAEFMYEAVKIPYVIPESNHNYIVDFVSKNGVFWELKGYLSDHKERYKYVLLKQQHPDLDLRFVFDNPNKLCGGTKMTHAKWAEKYNFPYCSIRDVEQIQQWVKEANG